jgi:hypothetical protein
LARFEREAQFHFRGTGVARGVVRGFLFQAF